MAAQATAPEKRARDMTEAGQANGEIFIVDDDPSVRDALATVFSLEGYQVTSFANGASFLGAAHTRIPACILLDVHMPGASGLDILRDLNAQDYGAPIFMISGQGDIPMAVDAIKNGALDFIEKPFRGSDVVTRVREAIEASARQKSAVAANGKKAFNFPGREPLTSREQDVLDCIVKGESNKEAARRLGISPRTIEVHRARIMEKLGARNAADLVRIVLSENRSN
jgi:two-component system, LuxR family, response regulator FixJ